MMHAQPTPLQATATTAKNEPEHEASIQIRPTTPVPQLLLAKKRVVGFAVAGAAVVVLIGIKLRDGLAVVHNVRDDIGTSTHADWYVDTFQTVNGFLSSFIEMFTEWYFKPLWAIIMTYVANIWWLRREKREGHTTQRPAHVDQPGGNINAFLIWMPPVMMYLLNVGFTSMFVDHQVVSIQHAFSASDLHFAHGPQERARTNGTSAMLDTVLHSTLTGLVRPYEKIPRKCKSNAIEIARKDADTASDWVPPDEIGSTAVLYGFQARDWNFEVVENMTRPDATLTVSTNETGSDSDLREFHDKTGMSMRDAYALLVQGQIFLERSIANGAADEDTGMFNCDQEGQMVETDVEEVNLLNHITLYYDDFDAQVYYENEAGQMFRSDGTQFEASVRDILLPMYVDDRIVMVADHKLVSAKDHEVIADKDVLDAVINDFADSDAMSKGINVCRGVPSSLSYLSNYNRPENQTITNLLHDAGVVLKKTLKSVDKQKLKVRFNWFDISQDIALTAMTLTIPGNMDAQQTSRVCEQLNVTSTLCEKEDVFAFFNPERKCSATSCVYQDPTEAPILRKQILVNPFFDNITLNNLEYDTSLMMNLPRGRTKVDATAFVYGSGGFVAADAFAAQDGIPYLQSPRRYHVLTFAKLTWRYRELDETFNANCDVNATDGGCAGVAYRYQTAKQQSDAFKSLKDHDRGTPYRFLLAGKRTIEQQLKQNGFRSPTTLVSIFAPQMYSTLNSKLLEWEPLDRRHVKEWASDFQPVEPRDCTREVEAFLAQMDDNRYKLDDPLLPLMASSFFHLFQHGALRDAEHIKAKAKTANYKVKGYGGGMYDVAINLNGNTKERKIIRFKVPGFSVWVTCIGVVLMWLATAAVINLPKKHQKVKPGQCLAEQYVEMVDEEEYPPTVHRRLLIIKHHESSEVRATFADGAGSLPLHENSDEQSHPRHDVGLRKRSKASPGEEVDLDNYEVERLLLHHGEQRADPIELTNKPTFAALADTRVYKPQCTIQ